MIQATATIKPAGEAPAKGTANASTDPNTGAVTVTPKPAEEAWLAGDEFKPLLEKFKSPADLAKSYMELEKKQSQAKPADPAPATDPAAVRQAAEKAGIDLNAINTEYAQKGELSEETFKALEAKGIKREQVDSYIEGQKALAANYNNALNAEAGSPEALKQMIDWAKANMTAAEISAYDSAVTSGNLELAKLAVRGLSANYTKAVGSDPSLIKGDGVPSSTGVKPFADSDEVITAMADKRYKNSVTYRKEVADRLAASDLFA